MTIFYLVRHGVTAHTGQRLSGRRAGLHLSEKGIAEAQAAARSLSRVKFGAVYSSPIERTLETAEIIAREHGLKVIVHDELSEVDYGTWTNRSFKALSRTKLWTQVQQWPSGARFPSGESLWEVQQRALVSLDRIRSEHPGRPVCCVTHAEVIRLVVAYYLGVHIDLFQRIIVGPASTTIVSVGDDGPKVLAVNLPVKDEQSNK
jgi:probable phosphomutase (TIGR03848 family)